MNDFINNVGMNNSFTPEDDVFKCIWGEYERVVLESLLTAFCLDFMVSDTYGGDVDTIHNVRTIGQDPLMDYKNGSNRKAYEDRPKYDHKMVESSDSNFKQIKHNARELYNENNSNTVTDAYDSHRQLHFLGNSKGRPTEQNANLDHVVAAKTIHDDRGRVLSGLSTEELADMKENLAFTNEKLNKSLGDTDKKDYVEKHPDLSDDVKKNMLERDRIAREAQNKKLFQSYYLDPSNPQCRQFYHDATVAAGKRGIEMGIRQVLGFVFVDVWLVTKQEVINLPAGCGFPEILKAVARGIEKGFKSALTNYKEMIAKFGEGFIAGSLASLATTLCNIFFTTSEQFIKYIREISASVIRSTRVLLLNPDDLDLGDRLKMSTVILATGASVLAGSVAGAALAKYVGTIPIIGDFLIRFCSTLVSGLLSCSFLIYMDRSKFINQLVDRLNEIPTEVTDMKEISAYLEQYAAELSEIDIEQFRRDTEQFQSSASELMNARNDSELNSALKGIYDHFELPWKGDFSDFMSDKNNHLVFE